MFHLLWFALWLPTLVFSQNCPQPEELPFKDDLTSKYVAAVGYSFPSSSPEDACIGDNTTLVDGGKGSLESGTMYFGSVVVRSGCQFSIFKNNDFSGESFTAFGPIVLLSAPGFEYESEFGFKSWVTDCQIPYIDCTPEDRYELEIICDARNSTEPVICRKDMYVGTIFAKDVKEAMNFFPTIKENLKEEIFNVVVNGLKVSETTNVNWEEVLYAQALQDYKKIGYVESTVMPGFICYESTLIGECGGTLIYPNYYYDECADFFKSPAYGVYHRTEVKEKH